MNLACTWPINTWIELSKSSYANNLSILRRCVGSKVELSLVVKSNAYGHGLALMGVLAEKYGADSFCVYSMDEAMALRVAGVSRDILILGNVPACRLEDAVNERFKLLIQDCAQLPVLNCIARRRNVPARVHLMLETGLNREGVKEKELSRLTKTLLSSTEISVEGICSHFACADDPSGYNYTLKQLNNFKRMAQVIKCSGVPVRKRHIAASAGVMLYPDALFNMVRVGLSQYGLWPSPFTARTCEQCFVEERGVLLSPVLTWKTRVCQVRRVAVNNCIGYGSTYKTTRASCLALLPVGYADGYDRRLSNQSHVLIRGRRARVLGRVSMNSIIVDATDIPNVAVGDHAVLIGRQGLEQITVEELALAIGSINYDMVTRIGSHIPRVYVS